MTLTAGRFTYDPATQQVAGPAQYVRERGSAKLDAMLAGTEAGFNAMLNVAPLGTDTVMIVLVALQTDFAGWMGMKQLEYAVRRGRI